MKSRRHVARDVRREFRIRHLQGLVQTALVQEAPDDGVAEPGMDITVRYGGGDATETYLMANREEFATADLDIEVCSPQSPWEWPCSLPPPATNGSSPRRTASTWGSQC